MKRTVLRCLIFPALLFSHHIRTAPAVPAGPGAERPALVLETIIGDVRGLCVDNQSVAATADGTICLLMGNNRIAFYHADGTYARSETSPRPVRWPRYDTYLTGVGARVLVGELHLDYPWVFDERRKGSAPGRFRQPADVAADKHGRVYVADRGNRRIQVFDAADPKQPLYVLPLAESPVSVAVTPGRLAVVTAGGTLSLFGLHEDSAAVLASQAVGTGARDLCFTRSGGHSLLLLRRLGGR